MFAYLNKTYHTLHNQDPSSVACIDPVFGISTDVGVEMPNSVAVVVFVTFVDVAVVTNTVVVDAVGLHGGQTLRPRWR